MIQDRRRRPAPDAPGKLVLIHGAWAGAWVWDRLIDQLARLGRRAEAPQLPGNGYHPIPPDQVTRQHYLDCLDAAIGDGPVTLVGHSGGGMLVSAALAAFPGRISHAIWLAGMLLPEGQSCDDLQQARAGPGPGSMPFVQMAPDGLTCQVPVRAAVWHFFQDATPVDAMTAARRLTPQPLAGLRMDSPRGPGFDSLPKLYVLARQDRLVLPEAQRRMTRDVPNLDVIGIDSGHVPQLTRPAELAALLDGWLPRR